MNKIIVLFLLFALLEVQTASSQCPLSSKTTLCTPTCKDDTECRGEICCPNLCNTKSCMLPDRQNSQSKYKTSSSGGAFGSYCGQTKCRSSEKCELDRRSNQMKCVRA